MLLPRNKFQRPPCVYIFFCCRGKSERTAAGASTETLQADASRMSSDSHGTSEGPKTTLEKRSDSARSRNADSDDRSSAAGYSDSLRRERGSNRRTAAESKGIDARGALDRGNDEEKGMAVDLRNESEEGGRDERDEHNAEQDPLIPNPAASSKPGDDKHTESAGADVGIGIARGGDIDPAGEGGGGDDDLEDAAEGRFQGMRSRMKKAGQDLMNKSPTFRRASAEDKLRLGGARPKDTEDGPESGRGYKETVPDAAAGVDGGAREGGGNTNASRLVGRGGRSQNQEDSDTERCAACGGAVAVGALIFFSRGDCAF